MARRHQRLRDWLAEHPWTTRVALIALIAGPGYFRLESVASDAQEAADAAHALNGQNTKVLEQIERERISTCVRQRQDTRAAIIETVNHISQTSDDPTRLRQIARELDSVLQDVLPADYCSTITVEDP